MEKLYCKSCKKEVTGNGCFMSNCPVKRLKVEDGRVQVITKEDEEAADMITGEPIWKKALPAIKQMQAAESAKKQMVGRSTLSRDRLIEILQVKDEEAFRKEFMQEPELKCAPLLINTLIPQKDERIGVVAPNYRNYDFFLNLLCDHVQKNIKYQFVRIDKAYRLRGWQGGRIIILNGGKDLRRVIDHEFYAIMDQVTYWEKRYDKKAIWVDDRDLK